MLPTPPLGVRLPVLIVSAVVAASSVYGLWLALLATGQVLPGLTAFEGITLLAGLFGIGFGLGKFSEGFGLGVLTLAGTVLVCGVLSFLDGAANMPTQKPMLINGLLGRALCAAVLAGLAAVAVLSRSGRSWRVLLKGAALGAAPAAIVAAGLLFRGPLTTPAQGPAEIARVSALLVGTLVVFVLVSVSVGMMIRAFELGPDGAERRA